MSVTGSDCYVDLPFHGGLVLLSGGSSQRRRSTHMISAVNPNDINLQLVAAGAVETHGFEKEEPDGDAQFNQADGPQDDGG